jgi:hypothetical protein
VHRAVEAASSPASFGRRLEVEYDGGDELAEDSSRLETEPSGVELGSAAESVTPVGVECSDDEVDADRVSALKSLLEGEDKDWVSEAPGEVSRVC